MVADRKREKYGDYEVYYYACCDRSKPKLHGRAMACQQKIFLLLGRTSLPSLSRLTRRPWKAGRRNTSASCQQSVAQVIVHQKHVSHESGPQRSRSTTRSTPAHLARLVEIVHERQQRGSSSTVHTTRRTPQHQADLHSRRRSD